MPRTTLTQFFPLLDCKSPKASLVGAQSYPKTIGWQGGICDNRNFFGWHCSALAAPEILVSEELHDWPHMCPNLGFAARTLQNKRALNEHVKLSRAQTCKSSTQYNQKGRGEQTNRVRVIWRNSSKEKSECTSRRYVIPVHAPGAPEPSHVGPSRAVVVRKAGLRGITKLCKVRCDFLVSFVSLWCRGGSRYVEGCWGFPHLKIQIENNFHF